MGQIQATKDVGAQLTSIKASGKFEAREMLDWLMRYYEGEVTKFILWDFAQADLSALKTEELRGFAAEARVHAQSRKGGKTALVFSRDSDFGLGRLFEALAEMEEVPFTVRSFRSMKKAKEWLGLEA